MTSPLLRRLLLLIAVLTVLSGAVQLLWPAFVLHLVSGPDNPGARHFFGIVGMFMVLFGGLACQALRAPESQQALPLRWAALQKLGASAAVGLGYLHSIFGAAALLVAGFDLLSALLFLLYLRQLARNPG
jgi:O-antigen/teichoic acid export membrane protein